MNRLILTGLVAALSILPVTVAEAMTFHNMAPAGLACNLDRALHEVGHLGVRAQKLNGQNRFNWYFFGVSNGVANEYGVSKLTCKATLIGECLGLSGLPLCPIPD